MLHAGAVALAKLAKAPICLETALYSFTGTLSSPKLIDPLHIALAMLNHLPGLFQPRPCGPAPARVPGRFLRSLDSSPMTRQQRLTLIATILGSTVVFLDGTVVNVALPAIGDGLHVGLAGQQWVVEAYTLPLVALLLVGGSLGDQFGRRRMFVVGLVSFGAMSALCAVAPSSGFLIAARALQGIAGALLVPGSLAIVAATFDGEARGKAVGTWTAWTGIATVIGPAGGGALIGDRLLAGDLLGQRPADRAHRRAYSPLGAGEP